MEEITRMDLNVGLFGYINDVQLSFKISYVIPLLLVCGYEDTNIYCILNLSGSSLFVFSSIKNACLCSIL